MGCETSFLAYPDLTKCKKLSNEDCSSAGCVWNNANNKTMESIDSAYTEIGKELCEKISQQETVTAWEICESFICMDKEQCEFQNEMNEESEDVSMFFYTTNNFIVLRAFYKPSFE